MLKCCAKVVLDTGEVMIHHVRIPGFDVDYLPFSAEEMTRWLLADIPGAVDVIVYGPRSAEYRFYMEISGYQEKKP